MGLVIWDWFDLSVRWLHVIAGIAWIGSSFYFVHLDSSIKRAEKLPEGAGGETWQVHGGGFYHMVKYLVAPSRMPEQLTWFKWEAYTTWLSGIAMLVIIYYFGAELYLIDYHVLDLTVWQGVAISIVGLLLGWVVYDLLCRSQLGGNNVALAAVGFILLVVMSYLFTLVFSARGAYMQMGALIGTMMVANVLMVIIPNQKKVVADLIAGRQPDPKLGQQAKQRSMHNNYLTLPVLFLMISNHYPLAYASRWNWLILALVLVIGAAIRHFFNVRHKGGASPWWTLGVAAVGFAAVIWLSSVPPASAMGDDQSVSLSAVEDLPYSAFDIVTFRCSMCHASQPMWPGMRVAPNNVVLETPEQIRLHAHAIQTQSVMTHAMPPSNITEMEPVERAALGAWIANGAPDPAN